MLLNLRGVDDSQSDDLPKMFDIVSEKRKTLFFYDAAYE